LRKSGKNAFEGQRNKTQADRPHSEESRPNAKRIDESGRHAAPRLMFFLVARSLSAGRTTAA
jgi:hypothetical protein